MKKRIAATLRRWANGLDPKGSSVVQYNQMIQAIDYDRLAEFIRRTTAKGQA